jgi:hypothetical protein
MTVTAGAKLTAVAVLMCALASTGCSGHNTSEGTSSASRTSTPAVTLDDLLSAPVPALCEHEAGSLVNGELPVQDPQRYGYVHIAHMSAADDDSPMVAFGDLTGDGVADGAMVTACSAGGVGWPATVQLYTAGKTRLGGVDLGDVTHGGRESVTDITISDGMAHVSWITTGPGEGECCGTVKMAGDLRVKGANVVMENVRKLN